MENIICNKCGIEKNRENNFRKNRRVCKDCEKEHGRNYRREHKDKSKAWVNNNKEKMKELQSNWYEKNKPEIRKKASKLYQTDDNYRKIINYRTSLRSVIKGKQNKSSIVGCDRSHLIKWCKLFFDEKMTVENHGDYWVFDHIIPLEKSESDELFDIYTKWYNIMPVLKEYNLTKNKYIDEKQIHDYLKITKENPQFSINSEYIELLAKHLIMSGSPLEP